MTVREVIKKADEAYPNVFSFSQKAGWLEELDNRVFSEVFSRYEDSEEKFTGGYCEDDETELLIGKPYDDIYIRYLVMNFDIVNSDMVRYQNSAALFNSQYIAFGNFYNRTHRISSAVIDPH